MVTTSHLLQLEAKCGTTVSIIVSTTGLTIHNLLVKPPEGPTRDLVCGPDDIHDYSSKGRRFLNQVIGRYTNRLAVNDQSKVKTADGQTIKLDLEGNGEFDGMS